MPALLPGHLLSFLFRHERADGLGGVLKGRIVSIHYHLRQHRGDALLKTPDLPKLCIVDFHAEATGEKRALGFYADGRVTALFGTHTHVPTADECLLPHHTGYITDAGMTGVVDSVLGVKPEIIIGQLRTKMPARFDLAKGPCKMDCVLFSADERTGLCTGVERMTIA